MPLSASATIVLALACCALVLSMIAAVGAFYQRRNGSSDTGFRPTNDQADYMRQVRRMNVASLFHSSRSRPNYYNQHPSVSEYNQHPSPAEYGGYNGYNGKSPQVSEYNVMSHQDVCK